MEKVHKKNFKNISVIILFVFSSLLILSGCGKATKDNSQSNLSNIILSDFQNAKKLYENKEYAKANEEISKIPSEYTNSNMKNDIDNLKNDISKKLNDIKDVDNKLNEVSKLIDDGNLTASTKVIDELKNKELTEDQDGKLKSLENTLNKKINEKKAIEKKKEEEKKLEEKKSEVKKEKLEVKKEINQKENTSKNSLNKKSTTNAVKKTINTEGNIYYVNKALGIKMELPANWRGKYYVHESNDGLAFCYKTSKNKNIVGTLLCIEKLKKNSSEDEITLDDMVIKKINGSRYAIGVPTDVGTNAFDLGEIEIYKDYRSLKNEKGLLYRTLQGIN